MEQSKSQKTVEIHSKEENAKTNNKSNKTAGWSSTDMLKDIIVQENKRYHNESANGKVTIRQKKSNGNAETLEKISEKSVSNANSTWFNYLLAETEEKNNNLVACEKNSDKIFEALERMCETTVSDPNNTLVKYLHSEHMEEILGEVKEYCTDGKKLISQNLNDETEAEDFASFNIWENTIVEPNKSDEESHVTAELIDLEKTCEAVHCSLQAFLRHNCSTLKGNEEIIEDSKDEQEFNENNDTWEEVEYLLKRGMEYMTAESAAGKSRIKQSKAQPNSSTSLPVSTTASFAYTTPFKKTTIPKDPNALTKRFDMCIKPIPKFDIFAISPARTRTKEQKFFNILSLIGSYVERAGQTPIMSSMNCKTNDFNSTALVELDNQREVESLPDVIDNVKRPALSNKECISTDVTHMVDECTSITSPATKK